MSIASNLGMAWITSDLSSTGAIGGMQNMANAVSGNPEDSVFQNLITQMLMQKNIISASGAGLKKEEQNQSGNISNILSGLLLGANPSKIKMQNIMNELGETSDTNIDAGVAGATDESAVSLEMIQALMLGMTNASQFTNNEKIDPEIKNPMSQMNSAISDVQFDGSESKIIGNQSWILNSSHQEDSTENHAFLTATGTRPEVNGSAELTGNVTTASFHEVDFMEQKNPQDPIMMEKRDMYSDFKISETENQKQTDILDSKSVERIVGSVDEMKHEIENNQPIGSGNPNPLQSSGSVIETQELNQLIQTSEKVQPYTQISNEILMKLEQKGPTEFKMQLDPENLGQIDIKLKINDGKLIIDILAANSKTQEMLAGQVDKLISSMGLQNVKVESVQVNQQMNSQSQDSQNQGYAMNFGMDFSQRKQQESFQQEIFKGNRVAGVINSLQNETQTVEQTTGIGPLGYDPHRMNYAV